MKIDQIEIKRLEIPFNVNFKHSSAERNITESVLVKVRSAEGSYGLGEGPSAWCVNAAGMYSGRPSHENYC